MLDNELIALLRTLIIQQFAAYGLPQINVKQKYQPESQGTPVPATAFLFKIGDRRIGSPERKDEWDQLNQVMIHTEKEQYETTFQAAALSIQNPADVVSLTASDILNKISAILQGDAALELFKLNKIGILRITDIRNVPFRDDRDRYEFEPTFDFTVTHEQVTIIQAPVLETQEFNIISV